MLRIQVYDLAAQMVVNALQGTIHATLDSNPDLVLTQAFIDELKAKLINYLKKTPTRQTV